MKLTQKILKTIKKIRKRHKVSTEVDYDVAERVKNAVYWTPGLKMARFIEKALEDAIQKLEEERGGRCNAKRNGASRWKTNGLI